MIFLDFEASGAVGGYPIEVGFCVVEADKSIRSAAKLIGWGEWLDDASRWDQQAEQIHHITRDELVAQGEPPVAVMRWLNDELAGMVAFCDSHMDKLWLDELSEVAGIAPAFGLEDVAIAFDGPEIFGVADDLEVERGCRKTHRAAQDAEFLAVRYLMSMRVEAGVHRVYRLDGEAVRRPIL